MSKFIKGLSQKIGLAPGTLVHIGEKKVEKVRIRVIDYDGSRIEEKEFDSIEETFEYKSKTSVSWINIDGLHDTQLIEKINSHFGVHPLVSSDIVNTGQRPKMEDYGDYLYVVLKMLYYVQESDDIVAEQMSFVVGMNYVISFQERVGDVFEPVRKRLRDRKGRIRTSKSDYLVYTLIDAIVDNYFTVLEITGDQIERLEESLVLSTDPKIPQIVHRLKRNIIYKRKLISPTRELISGMQRSESKIIKKETNIYLRDVYDHVIHIMDTIESYRDILSGMHDIYLSNASNRMNEIMKVLTIFAAIFIPLTFIAGIYGMNFEYMPELKWPNGYFMALGVMASLGVGMAVYFKSRKRF